MRGLLCGFADANFAKGHALVGRRLGKVYRLGSAVKVKLTEADPVLGSTLFAMLEPDGADLPWLRGGQGSQTARRGWGASANIWTIRWTL